MEEYCRVTLNPNNTRPHHSSLPLTFFDIPWLLFPPSNPLFFYKLPPGVSPEFVIRRLKHSLSVALSHFHHLAGKLDLPPPPSQPSFLFAEDDSVSFSVVSRSDEFHSLVSASELKSLVPELDATAPMAVRVTLFGRDGQDQGLFCLGIALRHVAADLRTFNNFMSLWCNNPDQDSGSSPLCCYDRTMMVESQALLALFLNKYREIMKKKRRRKSKKKKEDTSDLVRESFVVNREDSDRIKSWIETPENHHRSLYLSPYVLTCALIWTSLVKVKLKVNYSHSDDNDERMRYFVYFAGGITRVGFTVPSGYVGNCVGLVQTRLRTSELAGPRGLAAAAEAIGESIKKVNREGILSGAQRWMTELEEVMGSESHVMVVGSPKVDFYSRDFGWGRPVKVEEVEIVETGAVSLAETGDGKGGIELGIVLPKTQMEDFAGFFNQAKSCFCC